MAADQQKQLDRLKKDVTQDGDSSVPINTGRMFVWLFFEFVFFNVSIFNLHGARYFYTHHLYIVI